METRNHSRAVDLYDCSRCTDTAKRYRGCGGPDPQCGMAALTPEIGMLFRANLYVEMGLATLDDLDCWMSTGIECLRAAQGRCQAERMREIRDGH